MSGVVVVRTMSDDTESASGLGFCLFAADVMWVSWGNCMCPAHPLMIFFSMRMSPLQALLTALVPAKQRGSFLSLTIAIGQMGTALGAFVAGILYAGGGYRTTTFASAAMVLLLVLLVWKFLPEPTEDAVHQPEPVAS